MSKQFGVLVIGDEVLSGKRRDKHFTHVVDTLRARGMSVAWSRVASDDQQALFRVLSQTQQEGLPVFCFGGIGATPDDNTRAAAARAFGCPLQVHSDALALIESRYGAASQAASRAYGRATRRLFAYSKPGQPYCRVHTLRTLFFSRLSGHGLADAGLGAAALLSAL